MDVEFLPLSEWQTEANCHFCNGVAAAEAVCGDSNIHPHIRCCRRDKCQELAKLEARIKFIPLVIEKNKITMGMYGIVYVSIESRAK